MNPFQGIGARIFRSGGTQWVLHGGQWPGHRMLIVFGRESALAAYSCYRDRTSAIRDIARSALAELAAEEEPCPGEADGSMDLSARDEPLGFAGSPALSLPARRVLGSSIRLTCAKSTGSLTGRREYSLSPTAAAQDIWRYQAKDENRLLSVVRVKGGLRVVMERPACILESCR